MTVRLTTAPAVTVSGKRAESLPTLAMAVRAVLTGPLAGMAMTLAWPLASVLAVVEE